MASCIINVIQNLMLNNLNHNPNCTNKNCQGGVINGKNPKICKKCNPNNISEFFATGLDGEIITLGKYNKGWHNLDIPKEYKTKENYKMYCYLRYLCMDAKQLFKTEIDKLKNGR